MRQDDELFSEKVPAGRRTYFFNLKQTPAGDTFLDISETRPDREGDGYRRTRIMVFSDHIDDFLQGLDKAVKRMRGVVAAEDDDLEELN